MVHLGQYARFATLCDLESRTISSRVKFLPRVWMSIFPSAPSWEVFPGRACRGKFPWPFLQSAQQLCEFFAPCNKKILHLDDDLVQYARFATLCDLVSKDKICENMRKHIRALPRIKKSRNNELTRRNLTEIDTYTVLLIVENE